MEESFIYFRKAFIFGFKNIMFAFICYNCPRAVYFSFYA